MCERMCVCVCMIVCVCVFASRSWWVCICVCGSVYIDRDRMLIGHSLYKYRHTHTHTDTRLIPHVFDKCSDRETFRESAAHHSRNQYYCFISTRTRADQLTAAWHRTMAVNWPNEHRCVCVFTLNGAPRAGAPQQGRNQSVCVSVHMRVRVIQSIVHIVRNE